MEVNSECREEQTQNVKDYNFDHPNALDFDLAFAVINELLLGKDCHIPIYDFTTNDR